MVDSDILIDFLRTNSGLFPKLLELQLSGKIEIYFSSVTVMEIFAGESSKWVKKELLELFSNFTIISFDRDLAMFAGEFKRGKKLTISLADYIIAMATRNLGAYLATRNISHFSEIYDLKFFETND